MAKVYSDEIKKNHNTKNALKKSFAVLKRDLIEIFRFVAYMIFGTIIGAIILMIFFALYMLIYHYYNH